MSDQFSAEVSAFENARIAREQEQEDRVALQEAAERAEFRENLAQFYLTMDTEGLHAEPVYVRKRESVRDGLFSKHLEEVLHPTSTVGWGPLHLRTYDSGSEYDEYGILSYLEVGYLRPWSLPIRPCAS